VALIAAGVFIGVLAVSCMASAMDTSADPSGSVATAGIDIPRQSTAPASATSTSASPTSAFVIADYTGRSLLDAFGDLDKAGMAVDQIDASGQGRAVLWAPHWRVVRQEPAPGTIMKPGDKAAFYVVQTDE
jgi:beta-lactam-binding protein with PASTA domain